MKKLLMLSLVAILALFTAACGNNTTKKDASKLSVYTTVYPLQYFTERIGGNHVEVESIYPPGSNEHTFEPTQQDMMKIADSKLFFYIGLGLEGFVTNAKKTLANEDVTMVETTAHVDEKLFATSTATKDDHHEEEDHDHSEEGHSHGNVDPHVWLSPIISQELAASIKDNLIKKDPKNKEDYTKNYNKLIIDLKQLDADFTEMAQQAKTDTFFISHASFGYIAGTYGLHQQAISGLNSQQEPSQQELTKIASKAKKDNINYILFEQNVSSKLSEVIQKDVGAQSLTVNNLSVLTKEDIAAKKDYLTIMHETIKTFQKALQ
ncbi:metal ABC transporter solute-binding protein, Zn/Mn family [Kurthia sibirica]|uniref:Adhesin n=1 Tax=Kurthia sibirica TaxID=202750 RepID=A0A2U3AJW3_9BACL|nr:zinc ABC transporter substrate-binding protein [Kurthia sibirica]PWI24791.1 adhesin [Kurthia sibirica]GEK34896.1 adhesin [Kurthia sibirica]